METKIVKNNIPNGWHLATIEDVCENLDNKRKPITKSDRASGTTPYYGATGIVDWVSGYIFDEDLLLVGEDGADWSKFANTAYSISGKSWVNNHAHVLRCKKIDRTYLQEYLNYQDLNTFITGGTRGKLTKGVLSKIPITVPTLIEQKKIAEILNAVDARIQKTGEVITATEKLKGGLMRELLTRGIGHAKFKKTAIGEIPTEWLVTKLGEVATITRGGSPRPIESFITSDENGLNWLKIGDIKPGAKYIEHTSQKIKRDGLSKTTQVHEGDFILSNSMSFGRPYIMKIEACIHDGWLAFKDIKTELISSDFLYYLLSSKSLQDNFWAIAAGSGVKNLKKESVSNVVVALPSIKEQQRITEVLSAVDEKISISQKLKEKLTLLKKGLMQDLLTGKKRAI